MGHLLRWRPTRTQLLWAGGIAALAFLIIVICGYVFGWKWTGLVKNPNFHKRTLWDWLQLLIIPAVLAGVGLWFNRQQREQVAAASQQREQELQIADRRAQDEALQAYLDQIGQLLLDKDRPLRQAKGGTEVRTLARARTLTVLGRLDGERKGSIVQFLSEATLIQKEASANEEHVPTQPVISLSGADLRGADLRGAELSEANLGGANLGGTNLSEAVLTWAYLREARGWTEEQLIAARSLESATMPNDQKYEDWIKSRGEGASTTPEQRGPWWGGPYHRPWWRRMFHA